MKIMYHWVILFLFTVSQIVLSMGEFGWGPLAPFLKEALSLTEAHIGIISSVLFFSNAISAFLAGISVDRYGVRKNFLLWLGITGVPMFLIGFFHQSYLLLVVLVTISGLGYGMGNPVAIKGLYTWFDPRMRATAVGVRQAAVPLGGAITGILTVYVAQKLSWFMVPGIMGALSILMLGIAFFVYKEPPLVSPSTVKKEKGDLRGGFRELFSNRKLLSMFIIMALFGLGQGTITTFLTLYLYESLNYGLLMAGSLFSLTMIGGGVGRILWGIISDRLFKRREPVLLIMAVLATMTVAATALWSTNWPVWLFSVPAFLLGFLGIGWNALALVFIAELSGASRAGTAVGLSSAISWLGLAVGAPVFGYIVTFSSYVYSWFFIAGIYFIATLLCISMTFLTRQR